VKILITGGAGFIGSHIADRYIALGHEVVVLDNLCTGFRENVPQSAKLYAYAIDDPRVEDVFREEKPDVVSHHAAQIDVRKSVANPAMDAETNIIGSLKLLELCRKYAVKKVIFASTGGAIYGEQESFPADETHRTQPESPYGIAKLAIEKYLYFYAQTHALPYVALRYSNVYGPRQNALGEAGVVAIVTGKVLCGERPTIYGDGTQTRDYIFVDNVVDCNVKGLDEDVHGIFNVGTGVEVDVNTIVHKILQLAQKDVKPCYASARLGEQKRSCIHPGVLLEHSPIALDAGLKCTVEWFRMREPFTMNVGAMRSA
jgi:UDP-glucose 4-epimerase